MRPIAVLCIVGVAWACSSSTRSVPVPAEGGAGTSGAGGSSGTGSGGSSGRGGSAGSPSSGGSAGSSGSAGGGAGGSSGSGTGGSAGPDACAPSSAEDCFNGVDDDCDGDIDCADTACEGPATCMPDSPNGALGFFVAAGAMCPTGFSAVTLNRDVSASPQCTGCSCQPTASRCESGVYGYGPYTCGGFQFNGLLYNVFPQCGEFAADTRIHHYAVRGFTECSPRGTAALDPPRWAETRTFCRADRVGAGCQNGWRCAPAVTAMSYCSLKTGTAACAGDYAQGTGATWHTGFSDRRSCPECQCSFGDANCAGAYIQAFSGANCTGTAVQIGTGPEGSACSLPFAPVSGRIVGTPTGGSCQPNTYVNGELTATGPHTVCCR